MGRGLGPGLDVYGSRPEQSHGQGDGHCRTPAPSATPKSGPTQGQPARKRGGAMVRAHQPETFQTSPELSNLCGGGGGGRRSHQTNACTGDVLIHRGGGGIWRTHPLQAKPPTPPIPKKFPRGKSEILNRAKNERPILGTQTSSCPHTPPPPSRRPNTKHNSGLSAGMSTEHERSSKPLSGTGPSGVR